AQPPSAAHDQCRPRKSSRKIQRAASGRYRRSGTPRSQPRLPPWRGSQPTARNCPDTKRRTPPRLARAFCTNRRFALDPPEDRGRKTPTRKAAKIYHSLCSGPWDALLKSRLYLKLSKVTCKLSSRPRMNSRMVSTSVSRMNSINNCPAEFTCSKCRVVQFTLGGAE